MFHVYQTSKSEKKYFSKIIAEFQILSAISYFDLNKGELKDILSVGTIQSTEPETRAYSGNKGIMFLNNKSDTPNVEYKVTKTGIFLNDNTKQIVPVNLDNRFQGYLVGNNHGKVQLLIENPNFK